MLAARHGLRVFAFCFAILLGQTVSAADSSDFFSTEPSTNEGRKWRLGYLEGGPYRTYPVQLRAIVNSLAQLGWLKEQPPLVVREADEGATGEIWQRLASEVESDYIEFVGDAYWSAGWNRETQAINREAAIKRLNEQKDIDLMIAMGTWAGQDLASNDHSTPTLVFAVTDPLRSNIISSVEDSGYDHVHSRVDPTRYRRQVELFHTLIRFRKLGIAYIDNEAGRSFAALEDLEAAAAANNFELVRCDVPSGEDIAKAKRDTVTCHEKLAPQVDAVYITIQSGVTLHNMPELMAPLNEHKVPSFSQSGPKEVKYGALMSIAHGGFTNVARFHAKNIARVLNGARPRDLTQKFEDPPKIALNLKAASIIGYDPPVDILFAADELYQDVAVAE